MSDQIDWVIVGGESGPGARPCDLEWIRGIVRQCQAAGVPAFVKQLGAQPVVSTPGSWINELQRHGPDIQTPFGRVMCGACKTEDCRVGWPGYGPHTERWLRLRDRKGGNPDEWPEDLRTRGFPNMGSDGREAPADGAHDDGDLAPAGAEQDGELGCGVHGASVPRGGASAEGGTA